MMPNRTHATFLGRLVLLALCAMEISIFHPQMSLAQSPESVKHAMASLKAKTAKLGAPAIRGEDAVAGKQVPALYFGATKMNNNFAVVDEVSRRWAAPQRCS
jgi:hypothetical protein